MNIDFMGQEEPMAPEEISRLKTEKQMRVKTLVSQKSMLAKKRPNSEGYKVLKLSIQASQQRINVIDAMLINNGESPEVGNGVGALPLVGAAVVGLLFLK